MKKLSILAVILLLSACSGIRSTNSTFVAHAESFRILGFPIPEDDQEAAKRLIPAGANVENVSSTPADWTSVWGGLLNIIGFHGTTIGGTVSKSGK